MGILYLGLDVIQSTKRISEKLANISDENLFDNSSLLNDLHSLINDYYNTYIQKYPSDIDTQAIAQVLGILYGSIESKIMGISIFNQNVFWFWIVWGDSILLFVSARG